VENCGKSRRLSSKASIPSFGWIFLGMEAQTLGRRPNQLLCAMGSAEFGKAVHQKAFRSGGPLHGRGDCPGAWPQPPEGLQGIVVVGSGAKLPVTRAIFQMLSDNPEAFFETIGRFAFSPAAPVAMVERFVLVARQCPPPVIFNDFQACDHFDIRNRLPEIKIPTLVLCGEEDQLTPVKYSRYLHEGITTSSLTLIPNAGHMVMMEQPDPLNRGIESFLATLGA